MYLPNHQALFIHIPKCAGTSVEKTLLSGDSESRYKENEALLLKNKNPFKGPPSLHHLSALQYCNKGHISEEQWESSYKFTFVRNPLSRIVSAYNYRGIAIRARIAGKKSWTFKEFLFEYFPTRLEENYLFGHDNWTHVQPMWTFTHDCAGKKNLMDFVGRLENIKEDFAKVISTLKYPLDTELAHSNPSPLREPMSGKLVSDTKTRFHWAEYYDSSTLDFVRKLYQKDFELFDYSDKLP